MHRMPESSLLKCPSALARDVDCVQHGRYRGYLEVRFCVAVGDLRVRWAKFRDGHRYLAVPAVASRSPGVRRRC